MLIYRRRRRRRFNVSRESTPTDIGARLAFRVNAHNDAEEVEEIQHRSSAAYQ
jgi:hypothetical protein